MNTIISVVAYLMIYIACGLNRNQASKIPFFSKWWFVQMLLVTIAAIMVRELE